MDSNDQRSFPHMENNTQGAPLRHGTIVLLSGGLDSTVALYAALALAKHDPASRRVHAISFDYGQRHRHELEHAKAITKLLDLEHQVIEMAHIGEQVMAGSSQTSPDIPVPHGHYAAESMRVTVVPNRNMVMLSLATAWAEMTQSKRICIAAHAGDHFVYPDCRPAFLEAMAEAIHFGTGGEENADGVELWAPFQHLTKTGIVQRGMELGAPMHMTWSCYDPQFIDEKAARHGLAYGAGQAVLGRIAGYQHCGKCGTCVERKEAFQEAGVDDPTQYAG
jgi:7-cyano-7-deazaguanine synthase